MMKLKAGGFFFLYGWRLCLSRWGQGFFYLCVQGENVGTTFYFSFFSFLSGLLFFFVCYNYLFICKLICHFPPNCLVPKQLKKLWSFILFYFLYFWSPCPNNIFCFFFLYFCVLIFFFKDNFNDKSIKLFNGLRMAR